VTLTTVDFKTGVILSLCDSSTFSFSERGWWVVFSTAVLLPPKFVLLSSIVFIYKKKTTKTLHDLLF